MPAKSRKRMYLPEPKTIQRLAARIHDDNIHREHVADDEASRIDRRGGPRLLLLAIVRNAVNTLEEWGRRFNAFQGRPYEFSALRARAQIAFRYLTSEDCDVITRFRAVCDETEVDAEAIREKVFQRLDEPAIKALFS